MKWLDAIRRFVTPQKLDLIDIQELLLRVPRLQQPNLRIGWPDEPAQIAVADLQQFPALLDAALSAFESLRPGELLVDVDVNDIRSEISVSFVKGTSGKHGDGNRELVLCDVFDALGAWMKLSRGELSYWGGNNYFNLSFPFDGWVRESFPDVDGLTWDERYRLLFQRATWESLRSMVFRNCNLAEQFSKQCKGWNFRNVLIPSVGVCVHPWMFAHLGLQVMATDVSPFAIRTLSAPHELPRIYSYTARERWDISQSASYASQGNPERFSDLPDLASEVSVNNLAKLLSLQVADWTRLPIADVSVDAIFATNALPRDSSAELIAVLQEWNRVLRPGGVAFIAQHNFFSADLDEVLKELGWENGPLLNGWRPADKNRKGCQTYYSSG